MIKTSLSNIFQKVLVRNKYIKFSQRRRLVIIVDRLFRKMMKNVERDLGVNFIRTLSRLSLQTMPAASPLFCTFSYFFPKILKKMIRTICVQTSFYRGVLWNFLSFFRQKSLFTKYTSYILLQNKKK